MPADPHRAASVPSSPQAPIGVPETVTYETTDEIPRRPSHSRKTKFPVLMRWFGRWTSGGGFLSRSRTSRVDDDLLNVPRDPWASRVAMFVVAALFSFLVALVAMKVQRCSTSALPPSPATQASVKPAFPTPPAANAAPLVVPAPSAQPDPLAAASQPSAATEPAARADRAPAVHPQTTYGHAKTAGGFSARAVPGATGKLRTPPRRPDRLKHTADDPSQDALLPLQM